MFQVPGVRGSRTTRVVRGCIVRGSVFGIPGQLGGRSNTGRWDGSRRLTRLFRGAPPPDLIRTFKFLYFVLMFFSVAAFVCGVFDVCVA